METPFTEPSQRSGYGSSATTAPLTWSTCYRCICASNGASRIHQPNAHLSQFPTLQAVMPANYQDLPEDSSSTPRQPDPLQELLNPLIQELRVVKEEKIRHKQRGHTSRSTKKSKQRTKGKATFPADAHADTHESAQESNQNPSKASGVNHSATHEPDENRDKFLHIRISEKELIELNQYCLGRDRSDYVRAVLFGREIPRPRKVVPRINKETYVELGRIGTNLNQIARAINTSVKHGFPINDQAQACLRYQEQLEEMLSQLRLEVLDGPEDNT